MGIFSKLLGHKTKKVERIIGIDFGTTNTRVACIVDGEPIIIPNSGNEKAIPSIVIFTQEGEQLVGQTAKQQSTTYPTNTIYSIKRLMGSFYQEVDKETNLLLYKTVASSNGDTQIRLNNKDYAPSEISAMIFQEIKRMAEDYLGERITKAIVTVPAYFNENQRRATKHAGEIAGLEVVRLINEPTAASIAYGFGKKKDEVIAVYHLGGGMFDISIIQLGDKVFEVLSTCGDTHLGGNDFDQRIINWMISEFKREQGIDLSQAPMALLQLKEAAEKAKIELSTLTEAEIKLSFVMTDQNSPVNLNITLSRAKLEQIVEDLIEHTVDLCKQVITDAELTPESIDKVILTGNSTHMPKVQEAIKQLFGKDPYKSVDLDEMVVVGAAIQGGVITGAVEDFLLLDVIPLSIGIETQEGVFTNFIERNTPIPTHKTQVFTTAEDDQTSVEIHLLQGKQEFVRNDQLVGHIMLDGISPAPQGVPEIEVTFDIDHDAILNMSARDLSTGREINIEIEFKASIELSKSKEKMEEETQSEGNMEDMEESENDDLQTIHIDLRSEEYKQLEYEAIQDKSLGKQVDTLVEELVKIFKKEGFLPQSQERIDRINEYRREYGFRPIKPATPKKFLMDYPQGHIRAREIGQLLEEIGGLRLMQAVHLKVNEKTNGIGGSELSHAWNSIGDWRS